VAAPRQWTPEEIADVIRRHLQDDSDHKIAAALGRAQSTGSRLRKAPDIAARIADERATINAAENEQANAVKRERAREQSRTRSSSRAAPRLTGARTARPSPIKQPPHSKPASTRSERLTPA
jgi:hypothetical protein